MSFGVNINAQAQDTANNFFFCDIVFDDDTFATSGFPGAGQQAKLLPTADSSIGTWTGGGGGTTNLYQALDNIPPIGNATPADGTQISNANGSADQDATFTMQSYTTAGVPSGATINVVQLNTIHGEQINTGAKIGDAWIASNPTQSAGTTWNYGDDAGAESTYLGVWRSANGVVSVAPSITLGTQPTATIRKSGSTTRVTDACFMAIFVDFTPSAGGTVVKDVIRRGVIVAPR